MIANGNTCGREQQLDEVIAAYLAAIRAGQAPDQEEWQTRYPDLATELAEFFADRAQMERVARPLRIAVSTTGGCGSQSEPQSNFGDYELLEELGRGGMGVVYKARQGRPSRIVALKMVRAGQLASITDVRRFQAEAEAAASLDHPHIVSIYEVGECQGQHYFTMKLIEGGSLAHALAQRNSEFRIQNSEVAGNARLLSAVARAVHYAHQRGILHRDLKPANIVLDANGQPYVTDFGLAKQVTGENTTTQTGAIVGTASYMAPEQAAGSKSLTTAADVYSLGAILYELLAGRPPFRAATPLETLLQVREREPARVSAINPGVDRDLETICLKCLEKDASRRYGSAAALADDLDRWLAGEPIEARPVSAIERTLRRCRRNPAVTGLIAAVVLVGSIGIMGILSQWQVALANEQKAVANEEKANQNAATAQANAQQAKEKAQEATQQRDEAQRLQAEAQRQRDEVASLNERLQATQARLRRTLYAAHITLAQRAWEEDATERTLELLDEDRPQPGQTDLRGFEWHYLQRLCHS